MKRKGLFLLVVPFLSLLVSCGGEQTPTTEDDENQNQENNNLDSGDESEDTTKVEYLTIKVVAQQLLRFLKRKNRLQKKDIFLQKMLKYQ